MADRPRANERIPDLLRTSAAVRWISAEPLLADPGLARIDLPGSSAGAIYPLNGCFWAPGAGSVSSNWDRTGKLDWVVCGGESGPGARPMNPAWPRAIRDLCAEAGVAFFMKQMASKAPIPADLMIRQYPKAVA